jgi:hypothetical protein
VELTDEAKHQDLVEFIDGKMRLNLHPGQLRAWDSDKRFVGVLAGAQGGKTSFGPPWLLREIKRKGPGDYMIVTPTFSLCDKKVEPAFRRLFEKKLQLGEYIGFKRKFVFSDEGAEFLFGRRPEEETVVFFGHAGNAESLESATAKAVWCDEAGQKGFRLGSWEAIQRRLALHEGRALITTTPYDLGWLKQRLYDPWMAANRDHKFIDVIRFDSTENPSFPQAEFERMRTELPKWRFDLFYRAIFTRPAGLIYDSFDAATMKCPPFDPPATWLRYLGLDFGGINTAGVFIAEEPSSKKLYIYKEYYPQETRTARQHVLALLKSEPAEPIDPRTGNQKIPIAVGGSGSEGQWREEFMAAGLPVQEPDFAEHSNSGRISSLVEVGINRVYAAFQDRQIYVCNHLSGLLDELASYSRKLDESGNTTEEIEAKSSYHHLDGLRYVLSKIRKPQFMKFEIGLPDPRKGQGSVVMRAPPGVFLPRDPTPKEMRRWKEPWEENW